METKEIANEDAVVEMTEEELDEVGGGSIQGRWADW